MNRAIKKVVQNQSAWLCVSLLPFFFMACKDSPPGPPHVSSIQLVLEDASCTEAWLKVTLTDANQPRTVALKRDGQIVLTAQITANDSMLVDEGLIPNHSYTYQAVRMRDSVAIDVSPGVQVTTLDTTSHSWTFSIDTLGDASSVLYDVAIINDTLAYAVGEIYLRDSTGQIDPIAFSLAIWNGAIWTPRRLYYAGSTLIASIRGILVSATNDVWLAAGSVFHWDGVSSQAQLSFSRLALPDPNATVEKLWGMSSTDVYGVGNAGTIVHYANGTWQRIESGTSAGLYDIWGYTNTSSGRTTILGAVSSTNEHNILSLSAFVASDTLDWPIDRLLGDIWMGNRFIVYASGASIWRHTEYGWRQASGLPQSIFFTSVRGSRENNLFAISWRGMLAHFNGTSWHQHTEIPTDFNFDAVAVSENLMVAVGFTGGLFADKAGVVIGRRVP